MNIVFHDDAPARPDLHEMVREAIHAAGPVPRTWLHDRVCERSMTARDAVAEAVDDLVEAGDLLTGHGLIGPAPLRSIPLPGGGALLVGARPGRYLDVHILQELPRRVDKTPNEAREVPLERWTGLDRAPTADQAFLETLREREVEDDGTDWSEAYGWRDGRFRPEPGLPGLWRLRMPGRWFRYAWVDEPGRRPLTTDEGLRAAFALARTDGGTPVPFETTDDQVTLELPRLPRPEYRYVMACASRGDDWQWRVPTNQWEALREMLHDQLGLEFEETDGEA